MIIDVCLCLRYHDAADKAKARVLELLRGLSAELQTKINILIFASMLLVIAKALFSHVRLAISLLKFSISNFNIDFLTCNNSGSFYHSSMVNNSGNVTQYAIAPFLFFFVLS